MQIYWNKRNGLHKKEFNSQRINLEHQHGHRFSVLGHQDGRSDVMWKHSILFETSNDRKRKKLPLFREFSLHFNKGEYRVIYLFIYYLFFWCWLKAENQMLRKRKTANRKRWNRKTAYFRCKNGHKTEIWRFAMPNSWLANTSFEFLLEHLRLNFYFGPNWKGCNVHLYFFRSCTKYRSILRFNKSNIDNSHTNRVGLPVLKSKNVSV